MICWVRAHMFFLAHQAGNLWSVPESSIHEFTKDISNFHEFTKGGGISGLIVHERDSFFNLQSTN